MRCDRIHLKEFVIGTILLPGLMFITVMAFAMVGIIQVVYLTYLYMKGEPTGEYNLFPDYLVDKKLRFKRR